MAESSSRLAPRRRALVTAALLLAAVGVPALAQDATALAGEESGVRFGFEVKGGFRDSDLTQVRNPFPFPPVVLPVGQTAGFFETVDAGSHVELSVVTLWLTAQWQERWSSKVKLDLYDLHDRNPTSEDQEYDLDEAWIRWGRETDPGFVPAVRQGYAKVGKVPKFERQDDRHLESYGVVGTAFNRFEDVGLEIGLDITKRLYFKASYTQGNPVFLRDPNALAGDNGIPELNFLNPDFEPNPDPELKSGIPILYDTDPDRIDFDNPEVGLGLGARFGDASGRTGFEVLGWIYRRDLADTVGLNGTFYGGDLDLLLGPGNQSPLPVTGREKEEWGVNVWLYLGGFSFFGQYVDQDLGGLPRTGLEAEVAWSFELPYVGSAFGRQLFPFIAPAVRYSQLDPDFIFNPDPQNPSPAASVTWEWEKVDVGLRLGVLTGLDVTFEWASNSFFVPALQRDVHADEFLTTVRWALDWQR